MKSHNIILCFHGKLITNLFKKNRNVFLKIFISFFVKSKLPVRRIPHICINDDRFGDIICKLNGISNPFELNEDDVLIIPNIEYLNTCIKKTRNASEMIDNPKETYIQKIDKNNKQKRKNEQRSPNEQVFGDSNYIIDKSLGLVFY